MVVGSDLLSKELSKIFPEVRWYYLPASMIFLTIIFGGIGLYWPEDAFSTAALWLFFMCLFVIGIFKRKKHERIKRELKASAEADAAYSKNG